MSSGLRVAGCGIALALLAGCGQVEPTRPTPTVSAEDRARAEALLAEYDRPAPVAPTPTDDDLNRLGRASLHLDRAEAALELGEAERAGGAWLEADTILRGLEQSVRERLGARYRAEAERRTAIARRLSAKPPPPADAAPLAPPAP